MEKGHLSGNTGDGSAQKAKRRKFRKWPWISAAAVLVIAAGAAWAYTRHPDGSGNPITDITSAFKPLGPTNILLIGNNARNPRGPLDIGTQGGGQADIMMLAHIDPAKHTVELISIPRDTLFAMPQYKITIPKIKSLFFIGAQMNPNQAAQLTVAGVEKFTGMPIKYWVATDFQGFADAINAVGSVRVYISGRIYDPWHSGADFFPGWQNLNGNQALAYIRTRQNTYSSAGSNDFVRDDAQAQVLAALQKKLLNRKGDMAHIGSLIRTWYKDVATNMSISELVKVARAVHGAKITHMNLANVGDSMDVMGTAIHGLNQQNYITGAFYDIVNPAQVTKRLAPFGSKGAWTGVALPSPSHVPVEVDASTAYVEKLKAAGYPVTQIGSGGYSSVQIDYPAGHLSWGLQVGRTLATGNSIVQQGSSSPAVVVYGP